MFTSVTDVHRKIAILDTNLLVLWISSRLGFGSLPHFKRVKSSTEQDAWLSELLVRRFKGIATTAYVLAEASNLAMSYLATNEQSTYKSSDSKFLISIKQKLSFFSQNHS